MPDGTVRKGPTVNGKIERIPVTQAEAYQVSECSYLDNGVRKQYRTINTTPVKLGTEILVAVDPVRPVSGTGNSDVKLTDGSITEISNNVSDTTLHETLSNLDQIKKLLGIDDSTPNPAHSTDADVNGSGPCTPNFAGFAVYDAGTGEVRIEKGPT